MIRYDRLWDTMAAKGMTQYRLIKHYNFSAGQIGRLKKNMHVSTHTLDTLCSILSCRIEDILEYIPEGADTVPADPSSGPAAPLPADPTSAPITPASSGSSSASKSPSKPKKSETAKNEKSKKTGKSKKADKKSAKSDKKSKDSKKSK